MIRTLPIYLALVFFYGCSASHPPAENIPTQYDKWDCLMPPQVIALNNQGLNLEAISFRDFAIGKIDYKSNPDLRTLLEKEAVNSLVAEYLLCNAKARGDIDKNKPEQIQYLRNFFHFIESRPTPDQISNYPKQHPFPVSFAPTETTLSVDCHVGFLPGSAAPKKRIYAMTLYPTPNEMGGGGLVEYFSANGEFAFPKDHGHPMTAYECEFMNGGNVSIFNISMAFDLVFRSVVTDSNGHVQRSGEVTLDQKYPIIVNRIDPGPNGTFIFYIYNMCPQFVEVHLPKSVTFEPPGGTQKQTTSLIQPPLRMKFAPWK
jgi:hypothetical protein